MVNAIFTIILSGQGSHEYFCLTTLCVFIIPFSLGVGNYGGPLLFWDTKQENLWPFLGIRTRERKEMFETSSKEDDQILPVESGWNWWAQHNKEGMKTVNFAIFRSEFTSGNVNWWFVFREIVSEFDLCTTYGSIFKGWLPFTTRNYSLEWGFRSGNVSLCVATLFLSFFGLFQNDFNVTVL